MNLTLAVFLYKKLVWIVYLQISLIVIKLILLYKLCKVMMEIYIIILIILNKLLHKIIINNKKQMELLH